MKNQLKINGMHCASCAMRIEKTIKDSEGVTDCHVNYANEKASIDFDPQKISLEKLNEKIIPFGYSFDISQEQESAHQQNTDNNFDSLKNEIKIGFVFTFIAVFIMSWDILAQLNYITEMSENYSEFFHHLLPIFATYSMFVMGKQYLKAIYNFIKLRVANMDTLIGIGTLVAFIYSFIVSAFETSISTFIEVEHNYYDVVIVVITLVSYGKYLESKSKAKTGEAIKKLLNLQAKTALLITNGETKEIPIDQVKIGDLLLIKPGGKIPVDGKILEGFSSVDESMITGESIPTDKTINDEVIGGTINKQGTFKFIATKIGSETLLSQIVKMVEEAQGSRAPIQKLADQIASVFVPLVLVISVATFLIWIVIGSQYLDFSQAFSFGLMSFIGVLVIACPCALGLATPTAIIVGTGKGAENGILIKDAESLEILSKVDTIVLDKTGTITNGEPKVTEIIPYSDFSKNQIIEILATLESKSEHPLASAIAKFAANKQIKLKNLSNFSIIEGQGLTAIINGTKYYAGNTKLMSSLNLEFKNNDLDKLVNEGKTPVILSTSSEILGLIGIADTLKENAKDTIGELHKLGIKIILLSGDNKITAKFIAAKAGINDVIAEVLPQDKAQIIKELKLEGKIIAMVGDGVNDAPALAEANIGIAMGTGTDIAIETAQITLLKGDLSKILKAIHLSKMTMRAIKQNLFWAFIYNLIGIPLAAGAFYPIFGILLSPIFAGSAMAFSSISVVFNSLRFKLKPL